MEQEKNHIITIQLQDYFHHRVFKEVIGEKQWSRFESRLDRNIDDVIELLKKFNIKATFFTLGWIAEKKPDIIKKIVSEGHEIASSGFYGRNASEMTPEQFKEDIRRSKAQLEESGSNRIIGYRSISNSFTEKELWALEILTDEGYLYDSSYLPSFLPFKHKPFRRYAHECNCINGKIWEFPLPTRSIFGFKIPIGGGNYFRQFPHFLMFNSFKNWSKKSDSPFVLYLHPWELDKNQPQVTAFSTISKIRQYRNLGKMNWILPDYFNHGKFLSISQYLGIPLDYKHSSSKAAKSKNKINIKSKNLPKQIKQNVSVVIPCYNEVSSIPYLKNALDELVLESKDKFRFKFLFIDDCSSDDTYNTLNKIFSKNKNCRIIRHDANMGVAGAIRTGIKESKTELVCSIDADCSYDPLELLKMIDYLNEEVDMVTASPYHPDGSVLAVPGWRLFLSKSLSKIYQLFLKHKFATYTSCFRIYKRSSVINFLNEFTDFRGIIELLAKLDINGKILREYPTTLQSRIFGYSKMKTLKTIFSHISLLAIIWKYRRQKLKNLQ